jgi:hypothetical protein
MSYHGHLISKVNGVCAQGGDLLRATPIGCIIGSLMGRSSNGIVRIAPGVAQRILDEANFPQQRPARAARISKHLERLLGGQWQASMPISFALLPDGTLWLVDGQHRLRAIVLHDAATPVRILIHEVADEAAARRLYAYFDERDSVRNRGEVLDGLGIGTGGTLGKPIRDAAYGALALIANGFEPSRSVTGIARNVVDGRVEVFDDWLPEIERWQDIYRMCASSHRSKMKLISTLGVGIYTLRHQPQKAFEFWSGVARNDGLKKNDPRAALINDFHSRRINSGSSRQGVQAPTVAWNAFYQGRDLHIVKCVSDAPIVIQGTPFRR